MLQLTSCCSHSRRGPSSVARYLEMSLGCAMNSHPFLHHKSWSLPPVERSRRFEALHWHRYPFQYTSLSRSTPSCSLPTMGLSTTASQDHKEANQRSLDDDAQRATVEKPVPFRRIPKDTQARAAWTITLKCRYVTRMRHSHCHHTQQANRLNTTFHRAPNSDGDDDSLDRTISDPPMSPLTC